MEVKAIAKYVRVSPFKIKEIADLIQGKQVEKARSILNFAVKKNALLVEKVLKSALSNAENNFGLTPNGLYVKKVLVDKGPTFKRIKPRARGRADLVRRRTSHITVILEERRK
ncbi:MAG: 50S ribosomal protein L22 [Candidatus Aerophobetes bacterium]|nr:50S ribosomal protein L22 [Candidatus Aerophobetes bacterium]